MRIATSLIALLLGSSFALLPTAGHSQETFRPEDPFASVDGEPVFLGQLNLLLSSKLGVQQLDQVPQAVQQASAVNLVRQHLAMRPLRQQGGEALETMLQRSWDQFTGGLRRQGRTLDDYCRQHQTTPRCVRRSRRWQAAWRAYLKRTLTEENLKRYFQRHRERYVPTRWNVSHLFIPIETGVPQSAPLAKLRAEKLAGQLAAAGGGDASDPSRSSLAANFAELARQESHGATANEGGRLGWVTAAGDLPRRLVQAIAETPVGHVTPPTQTSNGMHLVLVHDREATPMAFAELKDRSRLRREAASVLFQRLVQDQADPPDIRWYLKELQPPTGNSSPDAATRGRKKNASGGLGQNLPDADDDS
jgi:peptidyl-prolyl cis-trans isomerase C